MLLEADSAQKKDDEKPVDKIELPGGIKVEGAPAKAITEGAQNALSNDAGGSSSTAFAGGVVTGIVTTIATGAGVYYLFRPKPSPTPTPTPSGSGTNINVQVTVNGQPTGVTGQPTTGGTGQPTGVTGQPSLKPGAKPTPGTQIGDAIPIVGRNGATTQTVTLFKNSEGLTYGVIKRGGQAVAVVFITDALARDLLGGDGFIAPAIEGTVIGDALQAFANATPVTSGALQTIEQNAGATVATGVALVGGVPLLILQAGEAVVTPVTNEIAIAVANTGIGASIGEFVGDLIYGPPPPPIGGAGGQPSVPTPTVSVQFLDLIAVPVEGGGQVYVPGGRAQVTLRDPNTGAVISQYITGGDGTTTNAGGTPIPPGAETTSGMFTIPGIPYTVVPAVDGDDVFLVSPGNTALDGQAQQFVDAVAQFSPAPASEATPFVQAANDPQMSLTVPWQAAA